MKGSLKYRVRIKVLSPLHIGDNDTKTKSPYTDFVLSDDLREVLFLPRKKLFQAAFEKEGAADDYNEKFIAGINNNQSGFDLKKEFLEKYEIDYFPMARSLPNHGLDFNDRREIKPTMEDAGRAFLPGSTLKGAIKTAATYRWLTRESNQVEMEGLEHVMRKMGEIAAIQDKKEAKDERWRLGKDHDFKHLQSMLNGDRLFRKIKGDPLARYLRTRDSAFISRDNLGVWRCDRIRLQPAKGENNSREIPLDRVAISPGTEITTEIRLMAGPMEKEYGLKWMYGNIASWEENLGAFARSNIQNELRILRRAGEMSPAQNREDLIKFYEFLEQKAGNSLLMRLGAGKTMYDVTLLQTLKTVDAESYRNVMAFYHDKWKPSANFYPVTRTVALHDGEVLPMGWVELQLETF